MDYNSLVAAKGTAGSLANWVNYSLLPISDLLSDAQALIYQTLRVREMRSPLTALTIPINAATVALPADFLDPIVVLNDYMQKLRVHDAGSLFPRIGVNNGSFVASRPSSYCIVGEAYNFDCAALAAYSYWQVYYQIPPLLSAQNDTNFLTRRYPLLLRTACLAVAADFRKDDGDYQRNMTRMLQMIQDIQIKDDLSLRGVEVDADYSAVGGYY